MRALLALMLLKSVLLGALETVLVAVKTIYPFYATPNLLDLVHNHVIGQRVGREPNLQRILLNLLILISSFSLAPSLAKILILFFFLFFSFGLEVMGGLEGSDVC